MIDNIDEDKNKTLKRKIVKNKTTVKDEDDKPLKSPQKQPVNSPDKQPLKSPNKQPLKKMGTLGQKKSPRVPRQKALFEQSMMPIPPPNEPMTQIKLGFLTKLKIFFSSLEAGLKQCFDKIMHKIYKPRKVEENQRRKYSMKFYPLEDIQMVLDEYQYRFERMDNTEDYNKRHSDDEESDDEDDIENMERERDRSKYFQFWQWNYMIIDNMDERIRKKDELMDDEDNQQNQQQQEESESEDESEESDNEWKNQLKLKEAKKEFQMLKKEVKQLQKSFKTNSKEMEKIEQDTSKLIEQQKKYEEDYQEICKKNKVLSQSLAQVFQVKDSIKHIRLKQ